MQEGPPETWYDPVPDEPLTSGSVDYVSLFRQLPTSYMVMDLDLCFVEVNDAYLATTGRTREELIGRYVFDAFPPTEEAVDDEGVSYVQRSFERARDTGAIDTMPLQKYAIPNGNGAMSERWWSLISVPIRSADGRVQLVAQRAEDVTDWARERASRVAEQERSEQLSRRVLEVESDLYARAHELEAALVAQAAAAARAASLASVAVELTAAESVHDLGRIVFRLGLPVLGAAGGALSIRDDDNDVVRLTLSDSLGEWAEPSPGRQLPLQAPIPAAAVAVTGEALLFPDRASAVAWHPDMAGYYDATDRQAWATLPLRVADRLVGALVVAWVEERAFTRDDIELLEAFAAQVSVALVRIQATEAERAAAAAAARMAEALQRSLLSEPPQPEGLQIAVRYQPAAQEAQVGGDWYDAFVTQGDAALVVIGDVTGHDREAAAAMAQIRNLLRGIAYESFDTPGTLLGRLDRAMQGLGIDGLATALLARVEGHGAARQLRWSNAGHPPAILLRPDGSFDTLDEEPDLLLGLDRHTPRRDHVTPFLPGSVLVLYTDGLIERRGSDLDAGVARVVAALQDVDRNDAEAVADAVLGVAGSANEDDIAVLAVATR